MSTFLILLKRNVKLFFKDRGMFFTSLITPAILLVLYGAFLADVYRDSFTASLTPGMEVSDRVIDGLVGGQLISSILAISCVTVAFCSNFLMVQDKALGNAKDLLISPVRSSILSASYYVATLISTLIICYTALALCLGYVAFVGWYLTLSDVLLLMLDVLLLVLFGTAISSLVNSFLKTQGQISAVGTIVSSGYGFICGAYMPISSFGEGLRHVISFLPGTYGTSLMRNHAIDGPLRQMEEEGVPAEVIEGMKEALDCRLYFFEHEVAISTMYLVLVSSILALIGIYILMNALSKRK